MDRTCHGKSLMTRRMSRNGAGYSSQVGTGRRLLIWDAKAAATEPEVFVVLHNQPGAEDL